MHGKGFFPKTRAVTSRPSFSSTVVVCYDLVRDPVFWGLIFSIDVGVVIIEILVSWLKSQAPKSKRWS